MREKESELEGLGEQLRLSKEEKETDERDWIAALKRLGEEKTEESQAILEELRKTHNTAGLLAYLKGEDARIESRVQEDREEQLKIKREIASVAYLTGEIDTAREALGSILKIDPNDIDAVNRLGHMMPDQRRDLAQAAADGRCVKHQHDAHGIARNFQRHA